MTSLRNRLIVSARSMGVTYKSIGTRFGITGPRARQIFEKHQRTLRMQKRCDDTRRLFIKLRTFNQQELYRLRMTVDAIAQ